MASLMASLQSLISTHPFVGLLTPLGSSWDQYLIERRQRALAASRDRAIHRSVGVEGGSSLPGAGTWYVGSSPGSTFK